MTALSPEPGLYRPRRVHLINAVKGSIPQRKPLITNSDSYECHFPNLSGAFLNAEMLSICCTPCWPFSEAWSALGKLYCSNALAVIWLIVSELTQVLKKGNATIICVLFLRDKNKKLSGESESLRWRKLGSERLWWQLCLAALESVVDLSLQPRGPVSLPRFPRELNILLPGYTFTWAPLPHKHS